MLALADVAVVVRDANASAEWWRQKLGFAIHRIGDHAILVAPPGERFVLHLCEGFAPLEPGNTGIAFLTDDLPGLASRLASSGVEFPEPYREGGEGMGAKFSDPDGNIFWLIGVPAPFVKRTLALRAPGGPRPRSGHKPPARGPGRRRAPRGRAQGRARR